MDVKRGQESWAFLYMVVSSLLSIVGVVISLLPDHFPKILIFICLTFLICLFVLRSGWCQNKLIGLKIKIENDWHDPHSL
jgi:uncharacterized membrane protein YfcA